jgi:hypothetical protein
LLAARVSLLEDCFSLLEARVSLLEKESLTGREVHVSLLEDCVSLLEALNQKTRYQSDRLQEMESLSTIDNEGEVKSFADIYDRRNSRIRATGV